LNNEVFALLKSLFLVRYSLFLFGSDLSRLGVGKLIFWVNKEGYRRTKIVDYARQYCCVIIKEGAMLKLQG